MSQNSKRKSVTDYQCSNVISVVNSKKYMTFRAHRHLDWQKGTIMHFDINCISTYIILNYIRFIFIIFCFTIEVSHFRFHFVMNIQDTSSTKFYNQVWSYFNRQFEDSTVCSYFQLAKLYCIRFILLNFSLLFFLLYAKIAQGHHQVVLISTRKSQSMAPNQ